MDQIRATELYRKLVEARKMPQIDEFAAQTGFDPRRDVRELLFAATDPGGVLLARGNFPLHPDVSGSRTLRYGSYILEVNGNAGFCILDRTLAVAGDVKSIEAALDQWKSGTHTAAQPLLARVKSIEPESQLWGVSTGFASFLADNMPRAGRGGGVDFSKIFRGLEDTWFRASFANGLNALIHGSAATEQDAANLRDTAKGLIGFGRLSVPENQPEMLKLWDGITVDQQGLSISIKANIPENLIERLVAMLSAAPARGRASR
jgi:hypothetical protein